MDSRIAHIQSKATKLVIVVFACLVVINLVAGYIWPRYPDGIVLSLSVLTIWISINVYLLNKSKESQSNLELSSKESLRLKVEIASVFIVLGTFVLLYLAGKNG